jgi:hypothetical protein
VLALLLLLPEARGGSLVAFALIFVIFDSNDGVRAGGRGCGGGGAVGVWRAVRLDVVVWGDGREAAQIIEDGGVVLVLLGDGVPSHGGRRVLQPFRGVSATMPENRNKSEMQSSLRCIWYRPLQVSICAPLHTPAYNLQTNEFLGTCSSRAEARSAAGTSCWSSTPFPSSMTT